MTLLLALPLAAADGATAKKKKKKKADPYEASKYKSYKVLTPEEGHTYRFDEKGEPIGKLAKKKKTAKKKSSDEGDEDKPECSEGGESCGDPAKTSE